MHNKKTKGKLVIYNGYTNLP